MGLISSTNLIPLLQALVPILLCFSLDLYSATDTITTTQAIKDPETIVSKSKIFKLGFFSPSNNSNRYVGIWYNAISVTTAIWVANSDRPLNDSSGTLKISDDGNLLVLNGQKEILWSSNASTSQMISIAQLLDSGNLALLENLTGRIIWDSFGHPSESGLSKMKLVTNVKTGEKIKLTSRRSPSDPSIGSFSLGVDPLNTPPQVLIWNGSHPYWRSGPWNGQVFIGVPNMYSVYHDGFSVVDDGEGNVFVTLVWADDVLNRFVLNSQGTLEQTFWDGEKENWEVIWSAPETKCDVYGVCGPFGSCNSHDSPICTCLRGFGPANMEEWSRGNWTSGCARKAPLQCERNNSNAEHGKEDGFLKLKTMKVPDFAKSSSVEKDECENQCLNNYFCIAYAYDKGIGCMQWNGTLIDVQKFSTDGVDLYIRVSYLELDKKRNTKAITAITVTIGSLTIAICTYFSWTRMRKQTGRNEQGGVLLFDRGDTYPILGDNMSQDKLEELPLFNFQKLAIATNNFDIGNKIGQGGFGPVYRGKFPDGQEVAVKRLSRASGQGLEEFMNEVVVISKLQHRNLVRLLGCCVEGEEKMLIYEYMPNKSLDAFLFYPLQHGVIDWRKRFNIIEGISRGLLYLHRDSRLKIIHRDLKASNILLDDELNPKISDFGMAKIFGGSQDHANTTRVVGTRGYMAPEYVMEGIFSEKSDVFSFGVLLLEIVSGRRNTSFYHDEQSLSLLGFAWKLWNEDKIITLIDPTISDSCCPAEILRFIHVGLLCVQEFVKHRPTISTVLSMISSEIPDLPSPTQPAFVQRQSPSAAVPSQLSQNRWSENKLTVTDIEGR